MDYSHETLLGVNRGPRRSRGSIHLWAACDVLSLYHRRFPSSGATTRPMANPGFNYLKKIWGGGGKDIVQKPTLCRYV